MNCYLYQCILNQVFFLDYLLPVLAIIISMFSISFSLYQGRKTLRLTEKHNIKSVEPLLGFDYFIDLTDDKKYIKQSFKVMNCGLGPAIVKSFNYIIDGEKFDDILSLYESKLGTPLKCENMGMHSIGMGEGVLAPNEKDSLFELYFSYTLSEDGKAYLPEDYEELNKKIITKIDYETIYGGVRSQTFPSLAPYLEK